MKALSIKQPWSWLIIQGFKDVENRVWATKFRGRIYVHAGQSKSEMSKEWTVIAWILQRLNNRQVAEFRNAFNLSRFALGAIIGEVDIVDCVTESDSHWFEGPYGLVLHNPVIYEHPISMKGRLGFWEVNPPERSEHE